MCALPGNRDATVVRRVPTTGRRVDSRPAAGQLALVTGLAEIHRAEGGADPRDVDGSDMLMPARFPALRGRNCVVMEMERHGARGRSWGVTRAGRGLVFFSHAASHAKAHPRRYPHVTLLKQSMTCAEFPTQDPRKGARFGPFRCCGSFLRQKSFSKLALPRRQRGFIRTLS